MVQEKQRQCQYSLLNSLQRVVTLYLLDLVLLINLNKRDAKLELNGTEHVRLYTAIKRVPKEMIDEAVAIKLDSDHVSSEYCGGMKRKLSVACASIGNP